MALDERATSLVIRQFFYDWEHEEPAKLTISRLAGPSGGRSSEEQATAEPGVPLAGRARQLRALGEFVEASVAFWADMQAQLTADGPNRFRAPSARTDIGGAAENVTVWGSWSLQPGEALLIEAIPVPARYWSVALGNRWWETLDYARHQSSLNGHQAVIDDDGCSERWSANTTQGWPTGWIRPAWVMAR